MLPDRCTDQEFARRHAAVRAAISAGDWILEPMYQAPSAIPPTTPKIAQRTFTRFAAMP